jgi:hypothetical protein
VKRQHDSLGISTFDKYWDASGVYPRWRSLPVGYAVKRQHDSLGISTFDKYWDASGVYPRWRSLPVGYAVKRQHDSLGISAKTMQLHVELVLHPTYVR